MKRGWPVALLLFALPVFAARTPSHVRVVLDLSQSMQTNDRGRMAILSTMLLHDLAQPNPTQGDSFVVIPFDRDWKWPDRASPPPVSTQARIKAELGKRQDFVQAITALPYNAKKTYFYPGIAAALEDLKQTGGSSTDIRAIVLVTDGVPERDTRDVELERIRAELAPQLAQSGARLYVLAFGTVADQNRGFFESMVRAPNGVSFGEYFVDPQGTRLLDYMLQIFARSFGYSPDTAHSLPGTTALDLDRGTKTEQVAVTIFSPRPQPPQLHLDPPANGSVNAPEGAQSAGVDGGSYTLGWVLSPNPGSYILSTDTPSGAVAVLRPSLFAIEIEPAPPHKQVEKTIAGTPLALRVLVRPANGATGDPGPVDLSFQTFGERIHATGSGTSSYAWSGKISAPAPSPGTATAKGRAYDIVVEFPQDAKAPSRTYAGYIEVKARRGDAVVGSLEGARAHRVEVHPPLAISPLPLSNYPSHSALERGQEACTQFAFHIDAGQLPHPAQPRYLVRSVLRPPAAAVLARELRHTTFTLDNLALEFERRPGSQPGAWYKGRQLTKDELLGDHHLCVQIGKPAAGDPAQPLQLVIDTTLLEDPYDDFSSVRPFTLKLLVSPPTPFQKWRPIVITGAVLLALLAALWYARNRPSFSKDLGYAIGREDSKAPMMQRPVEQRSGLAILLGLIGHSSIIAQGEDRALGRIRPVVDELYEVKLARDVTVEPVGRKEDIKKERRTATLGVQRLYKLTSKKRGSYLFRLEYR